MWFQWTDLAFDHKEIGIQSVPLPYIDCFYGLAWPKRQCFFLNTSTAGCSSNNLLHLVGAQQQTLQLHLHACNWNIQEDHKLVWNAILARKERNKFRHLMLLWLKYDWYNQWLIFFWVAVFFSLFVNTNILILVKKFQIRSKNIYFSRKSVYYKPKRFYIQSKVNNTIYNFGSNFTWVYRGSVLLNVGLFTVKQCLPYRLLLV